MGVKVGFQDWVVIGADFETRIGLSLGSSFETRVGARFRGRDRVSGLGKGV